MDVDNLHQLGMDLEAPGTTQKQQKYISSYGNDNQESPEDHFIIRDGIEFAGFHLIIDLIGAARLDEIEHIEQVLRHCIREAGATLLHIHLHHFTPNGGVTGVAILAESHISLHTWPERDYAAFDVFMCGDANPHVCIEIMREAFMAESVRVSEIRRGQDL